MLTEERKKEYEDKGFTVKEAPAVRLYKEYGYGVECHFELMKSTGVWNVKLENGDPMPGEWAVNFYQAITVEQADRRNREFLFPGEADAECPSVMWLWDHDFSKKEENGVPCYVYDFGQKFGNADYYCQYILHHKRTRDKSIMDKHPYYWSCQIRMRRPMIGTRTSAGFNALTAEEALEKCRCGCETPDETMPQQVKTTKQRMLEE